MDRTSSASTGGSFPPAGRDGITLIEVLVCLMLCSLLAAAVFPVVTQRVARGEPLKAMAELSSIREGIELFATDLPGYYPGDLEDLSSRIDHGDRAIVRASERAVFSEADMHEWAGPYLESPIADGGSLITGFGVPIRDDLIRFDASNNRPFGSDRFRAADTSLFVAVQIGTAGRQLTASQFEAINDLIDGVGEADGPGANSSWVLGRFRFDNSLVPGDSVGYFLTVPIER